MEQKNPSHSADILANLPDWASSSLQDYSYPLPQERIAKHPLSQRDQAKLLTYRQGQVTHHRFFHLPDLLPETALLVYNDTRVVKARLYFQRATGAKIEVLLLHPDQPYDIQLMMTSTGPVRWQCIIGNKKRWKAEEVLSLSLGSGGKAITLQAQWSDRGSNLIRFSWAGEATFSEILTRIGQLPLPPYLNRAATESDEHQYQTVYASNEGAVAAPTAGLHFTEQVLTSLATKGIQRMDVTLHVGAGTFLPVKTEDILAHDMHAEQMIIWPRQLSQLLAAKGPIIPVGTTSLRFVETLYWLGVALLKREPAVFQGQQFDLPALFAYQQQGLPTPKEALEALHAYFQAHAFPYLIGETHIYILPGYPFPLTQGLITNFHMPETTLMLLVAARLGPDWQKVYQAALDEDYRFLSYGDSSLLLPATSA